MASKIQLAGDFRARREFNDVALLEDEPAASVKFYSNMLGIRKP